jgi:hypothetical protein
VCADLSEPETAAREFHALEEAGRIFPTARRLLLTLSADMPPFEVTAGVSVEPAYAWILAGDR